MGLILKKDEKDEVGGIEVIGRGEGPDGLDEAAYDLVAGETAEDISGTTAAKDADAELEPDPELVGASESDTEEPEEDEQSKKGPSHGKLFIALAVVAVVVAGIGGYALGHGGFGGKGVNSASITESQLDTPVATWSYNGATKDVTARQAIESQYSLDTVKNDDDTYPTPAADTVLSYVRQQILAADAESRGITVSDEEITEYAKQTLKTSDLETIAKQYGVSKDQAKEIIRQQSLIQKLYAQVVPQSASAMPQAPTEPADGNQDTASKEYADYIINLAGDEWDKDKGTWAKEGGTYQQALKDQKFTADSATYSQAMIAYYTAYQEYSGESSSASKAWTEYVNGLFGKANITLYGLYA